MKYLVFNTEAEANAVNARVTVACNFTDGVTHHYSVVKKHPVNNQWALPVDDFYSDKFTVAEINSAVELTEDWEEVFDRHQITIANNDYTI